MSRRYTETAEEAEHAMTVLGKRLSEDPVLGERTTEG